MPKTCAYHAIAVKKKGMVSARHQNPRGTQRVPLSAGGFWDSEKKGFNDLGGLVRSHTSDSHLPLFT